MRPIFEAIPALAVAALVTAIVELDRKQNTTAARLAQHKINVFRTDLSEVTPPPLVAGWYARLTRADSFQQTRFE